MANILYGVNGEGAGHSTRSKEVITHLQEKGHKVHVVSFDRGLKNLSGEFEVTEIYGLHFSYVNNRVRYRKTVVKNLVTAPQARTSFKRLVEKAEEWKIDVVVTDFEPLSCRVGHRLGLPVISIDNQHFLTNATVTYPREYRREAAAAKLVTRCMTHGADAYLAISIFDAPVRKKNTFVFPPIVRREVLESQPTTGEHAVVYVTSPSKELEECLRKVACKFFCYGFDRAGEDGNLIFKKPSMDGFLRDLVACKAVVANSGFSLVSEALHLGKPYLAMPVKRQFEQVLNAYYVDKMSYGAYCEDVTVERAETFFANLPRYRAALASYPREGNTALLAKLDELIAGLASKKARAAAG